MDWMTTMARGEHWTEAQGEEVRMYWMQGYSSLWIGNRIGRTRRAVIGKVYRMGLTGVARPDNPVPLAHGEQRFTTGRKKLKAILGHKRSDGSPVAVKDIPMPIPSEAAQNGYRKDGKLTPLIKLTNNSCRWPVGDPQDKGFGFCGAKVEGYPECPYCVIHKRIAYTGLGGRR